MFVYGCSSSSSFRELAHLRTLLAFARAVGGNENPQGDRESEASSATIRNVDQYGVRPRRSHDVGSSLQKEEGSSGPQGLDGFNAPAKRTREQKKETSEGRGRELGEMTRNKLQL